MAWLHSSCQIGDIEGVGENWSIVTSPLSPIDELTTHESGVPVVCSPLPEVSPFGVLKSYYDDVDTKVISSRGPYRKTAVGLFVPSPILDIHFALEYLLEAGAIEPSGLFLDAGSGDGRIVALTALVHGISTVGVEYDNELVTQSKLHLESLGRLGLQGAPEVILRGDFGDDDTYLGAGLRFEDFTVVFNYINNQSAIASKVAQQSPPGTIFLLFGAFAVHNYQGLTLEQNLQLVTRADSGDRIAVEVHPTTNDASYMEPDATYLQVYRR